MATGYDILDLVGNTPMVQLKNLTKDIDAEVYVKLEYLNPSGSIKDRVAMRMIRDAERAGLLKEGMELIESTTGNMGTALAFAGAACGYPVTLYVPAGLVSEERMRIVKAYGAKIEEVNIEEVVTDDRFPQGIHGAIVERIPRLVCEKRENEDKNVWWCRQFANPSNEFAHRDTTGAEIVKQVDGDIDVFVAALGTGGTLLGVAEALKNAKSNAKIVAVEPKAHPTIIDGKLTLPDAEGTMSGGLLQEIVDRQILDEVFLVSDEDAIGTAHQLAEQEGLFCGMSSGANVFVALQMAKKLGKGQKVVTILVDSRDRYLFTERFTT